MYQRRNPIKIQKNHKYSSFFLLFCKMTQRFRTKDKHPVGPGNHTNWQSISNPMNPFAEPLVPYVNQYSNKAYDQWGAIIPPKGKDILTYLRKGQKQDYETGDDINMELPRGLDEYKELNPIQERMVHLGKYYPQETKKGLKYAGGAILGGLVAHKIYKHLTAPSNKPKRGRKKKT